VPFIKLFWGPATKHEKELMRFGLIKHYDSEKVLLVVVINIQSLTSHLNIDDQLEEVHTLHAQAQKLEQQPPNPPSVQLPSFNYPKTTFFHLMKRSNKISETKFNNIYILFRL